MIRGHLFFLLFALSQTIIGAETYHLKTPGLSDEDIIGYNVGIRPYRSLGMRIEAESLGGKTIIHNYGHGGAGITLSWGSAREAIHIMQDRSAPKHGETIAIIGAGIMGLSVANQLLDLGYRVRIYAREFENTTSVVAAGLWDPFGIAIPKSGPAKEQFERVKQVARDFFHELATSTEPRYKGVSYKNTFLFFKKEEERTPEYSVANVEFENGFKRMAELTLHMLVETPTFMRELLNDARRRGAEFIPYNFADSAVVTALQENVIFNCAGLGSREIFGDTELMGIRGQLIYVKTKPGLDYFAWAPTPKGSTAYFFTFPYKDKYIIGGSYEKGEDCRVSTADIRNQIMENARQFFATGSTQKDEL